MASIGNVDSQFVVDRDSLISLSKSLTLSSVAVGHALNLRCILATDYGPNAWSHELHGVL
jgi:hypothetical protein